MPVRSLLPRPHTPAIGDHYFSIEDGVIWRVSWLLYSKRWREPDVVFRMVPGNSVCLVVTPTALEDGDFQRLSGAEVEFLLTEMERNGNAAKPANE